MLILDPAALLINLFCTGTVIYLGLQIIIALRKSEEFRKNNSKNDHGAGKTNHLTVIVVMVLVAQALKFGYRLTGLIVMPILLNKSNNCDKNFGKEGMNDFDKKTCDEYVELMSTAVSYFKTRIDSALEILLVVVQMMRKKCP